MPVMMIRILSAKCLTNIPTGTFRGCGWVVIGVAFLWFRCRGRISATIVWMALSKFKKLAIGTSIFTVSKALPSNIRIAFLAVAVTMIVAMIVAMIVTVRVMVAMKFALISANTSISTRRQ